MEWSDLFQFKYLNNEVRKDVMDRSVALFSTFVMDRFFFWIKEGRKD